MNYTVALVIGQAVGFKCLKKTCEYKAEFRLTGDERDHFELGSRIKEDNVGVKHSLLVKLIDGNIDGIIRFKLFLPPTRYGDNEIFGALLFAYHTKIIQATENFKLGIFAATGGIALAYFINLIVSLFTHKSFYFITEWPESLKPFYIAEKDGSGISRSFDLQCGMLELASGGMRIHSRELLERRLERAGLTSENFSSHLRTFDWGMPPHPGWGLGFDRLMMILTGKRNIRDVVLFPRDEFRLMP